VSLCLWGIFLSLAQAQDLRLGIIGTDTSHAIEFTRLLNDTSHPERVVGARVVAAFPGGSPDLPASANRLPKFVATLRDEWKLEIVDTIPALLEKVDGVLLLSVDGRKHLEQIRPALAARKPVFIDKPLAAEYSEAREILRLCAQSGAPCFSASSLRFFAPVRALKTEAGEIVGVDAFSPATLEPHHSDLTWYGIHGVEILYTLMGPGCQWVERTFTEDAEVTVAQWRDGRLATYRGIRKGNHGYGALVVGTKGIKLSEPARGSAAMYRGLVQEIVRFMKTGVAPVHPEETLEMFAFMRAAQLSRERGGARVALSEVQ
jgi:predicted dehydrogenase